MYVGLSSTAALSRGEIILGYKDIKAISLPLSLLFFFFFFFFFFFLQIVKPQLVILSINDFLY